MREENRNKEKAGRRRGEKVIHHYEEEEQSSKEKGQTVPGKKKVSVCVVLVVSEDFCPQRVRDKGTHRMGLCYHRVLP